MLTESYLVKLEENHKIKNFDVSINELSKEGEAFEINLLYSYDLGKKKNPFSQSQKVEEVEDEVVQDFFNNIPKYDWKCWANVSYSDDFVESRKLKDGCVSFCC